MAYLEWPEKDPGANKDFSLDWTAMLATGETISTSTWAADLAGVTVGSSSIVGAVCTVWLSGGTAGATYKLTNTITTSRGMVDERTMILNVRDQ